jgi:undecaprenyl-diphosphatase
MDYQIFLAINSLAGKNQVLDFLGIFFGVWLIYLFGLFVFLMLFERRYTKFAILALISSVVSRLLIVELIKHLVNRPRPYEVLSVHQLLPDSERGLSFSSGHAVILFSIAFSFYGTKWFYPLLILATVGSIARVFIGVHFPLDVLGSFIIAGVCVVILRNSRLVFPKHNR